MSQVDPIWKKSLHDHEPQPAVGTFVITEEWLRANATSGKGWTRRQLEALGITWPPSTGWLQNIIGDSISTEQQAQFERARRGQTQEFYDYERLIVCARKVLFGANSDAKHREVMRSVSRDMKVKKPRGMEGKCILLRDFLVYRSIPIPEGAFVTLPAAVVVQAADIRPNKYKEPARCDRCLCRVAPRNGRFPGHRYCKCRRGKSKSRRPGHWGNSFYDSREWQQARYKAIKLYGRKCMACATVEGEMHVDHIKPRSKYPQLQLEISNLQILCRACNLGKSAWDETDWRPTETEQ